MGIRDAIGKHNPLRTKTYGGGLSHGDPADQSHSRGRVEAERIIDACTPCQKARDKAKAKNGRYQGVFCGKHGGTAAKYGIN